MLAYVIVFMFKYAFAKTLDNQFSLIIQFIGQLQKLDIYFGRIKKKLSFSGRRNVL